MYIEWILCLRLRGQQTHRRKWFIQLYQSLFHSFHEFIYFAFYRTVNGTVAVAGSYMFSAYTSLTCQNTHWIYCCWTMMTSRTHRPTNLVYCKTELNARMRTRKAHQPWIWCACCDMQCANVSCHGHYSIFGHGQMEKYRAPPKQTTCDCWSTAVPSARKQACEAWYTSI